MFISNDGKPREEVTLPSRGYEILKGCKDLDGNNYWSCNDQYCKFFYTCDRYARDIKACVDREVEKMKQKQTEKMKITPGLKLPAELEAKMQEIKEKDDEIRMAQDVLMSMMGNDKLQKLEAKREKIENDIEQERIKLNINAATDALNELTNEKNALTTEIGNMIGDEYWGPDAFTKGKKEAVASENGEIVILRSTRTERKIIPTKMLEMFPLKLSEMVEKEQIKITLKEAEKVLGKTDIDQICEKTITHTYESTIKDGRNVVSSA